MSIRNSSSRWSAVLFVATMLIACNKATEQPSTADTATASTSSSTGQAASQDSTTAAPVATLAPSVTCADVLGRMAGDKPGSSAPIPSDFPSPPGGSTLCGETFMHEVWYLNSGTPDNDLLDYYRKELTAKGYSVDPISPSSGGDQRIDFQRSGVNGYVATVGDKDRMSRKFKDVIKIAYHTLPK